MERDATGARIASRLDRLPPPSLFVLGAVSQYVGSALAVLLFASVPAAGVAWLRVVASAGVLLAWRRRGVRAGRLRGCVSSRHSA